MTRREMIADMLATAPAKCANGTGWGSRHVKAWQSDPKAKPIRLMVEALAEMADTHERLHGQDIRDDGYAGPYFEAIGEATIKLLSMDNGRDLDGGLIDGLIRRMGACEVCA